MPYGSSCVLVERAASNSRLHLSASSPGRLWSAAVVARYARDNCILPLVWHPVEAAADLMRPQVKRKSVSETYQKHPMS